jgi:hypothetical protein
MQTLKIQIPDGFEIDSFDTKTSEIKLKPKPKKVTDRIKTVADVLADHGITPEAFSQSCMDLSQDEVGYRLAKLLTKSLNEGWLPDWNNSNEVKYVPWFDMRGSSGFRFGGCDYWRTYSGVGSRLCFKSRELAEYAGKQFEEVYKQFMVIDTLLQPK